MFELGFGQCDDTPDDRNFTFRVPVSPYFKIGLNYNIFYNNSPDYQFNVGVRWLSMGWTARYHALLHEGKSAFGEPMYIPGYGKRSSHFTGSFSIIYTLPLNKKRPGGVNTSEGGADTGGRP